MATESNLGKVHIFPSVSSYNTNKSSVSASDLAFVPTPRIPIETFQNGNFWYVKYSDGWLEQGDRKSVSSSRNSSTEITFHIPFKDEYFSISANVLSIDRSNPGVMSTIFTLSNTMFKIGWYGNGTSDQVNGVIYRACGYYV